ncbi:extracellular calcium-sensing receptor-like [Lepisosteus oculatus]|uniref:extracellular calcium-sensing receptor-like n=1 Tax=Lepisosteus oculatus TaxID=7918 RepID=UPI0035F50863
MAYAYTEFLTISTIFIIQLHNMGTGGTVCNFKGEGATPSFFAEGDVVLGGLFPLHYRPSSYVPSFQKKPQATHYLYFSPRTLRWMQTMIFAVEEINKRQDLLPDIKLGYQIMDSGDDVRASLRSSLVLVNGQPADAGNHSCAGVGRAVSPVIVGDAASGVSMAVLRTLGSFHIPLVSYFASCSCLSNKREFPAFMRTMPSDAYQIKAIAQLASYFNWTWVGVIGVETDYARFAIQLFLEESSRLGVCAAYSHFYPLVLGKKDVVEVTNVIKRSSAKVVLNFSGESELQSILSECRRQNVTDIQWIASEAWATGKSLWKEFQDLLSGTVGFGIRKAEIPGLGTFLKRLRQSDADESSFFAEFWEETFECKLNHSLNTHTHGDAFPRKPCTGRESLERVYSEYSDVSQLRVSYNVYKAVYLIAHALHTLSRCENGSGPFPNQRCVDVREVLPWQLLHYMKQVRFSVLGEEVSFDENGDPVASYDLMNWQEGPDGSLELVKVGYYDASLGKGNDLVINESAIRWHRTQQVPRSVCSDSCSPGSRKATRRGQPVCCFDCVPCADGEISSQTDSLDCTKCPLEMWSNKARDQCIPKEVEFLSYSESMGMVLTVVSTLGACVTTAVSGVFIFFRNTPIVRANNMELSFLLLLFLILCFLIALTFIGEPTDWSCMVRYTAFGISFALCISCILAKTVVVLVAFRATLPGSNVMKWFGPTQQRASVFVCTSVQILICIVWLITSPPHAAHNTVYQSAKIILECAVGSALGFWGVLGYIGVLACLCFVIAFLARKLPDSFNEAKFITFSMLIFFAVWITFIPAYVSTPGKYTVAVQVFAILASAFGLLSCIFAPKCYIILLRPEKNSKKYLMDKSNKKHFVKTSSF